MVMYTIKITFNKKNYDMLYYDKIFKFFFKFFQQKINKFFIEKMNKKMNFYRKMNKKNEFLEKKMN